MSTVVVCITVVALLSVVMLDVLVSVGIGVVSVGVVTEDNVVAGDVVVTDVVVAADVVADVVVVDVVVLSCVVEGGVGQSASKEGVTVLSGIPRAYNLCIIDTNIPTTLDIVIGLVLPYMFYSPIILFNFKCQCYFLIIYVHKNIDFKKIYV